MRTRPPSRTLERAYQRGYFPLTVAIHEIEKTRDDFGAITETLGDAVLSDLACRVTSMAGEDEMRREDGTVVTDARVITLKTHQPTITTQYVAKVSGDPTEWNILAVDHDGQQAFTRLIVEDVG